jgi:hypothetical protein
MADFRSRFPRLSLIQLIPVVKRRWVLRRALFMRFGTSLGCFSTGMNKMNRIDGDKKQKLPGLIV